jgi:hypothetical protein
METLSFPVDQSCIRLLSVVIMKICGFLSMFYRVLFRHCPHSLYSLLEFAIREKNRESSSECTTSKARPN